MDGDALQLTRHQVKQRLILSGEADLRINLHFYQPVDYPSWREIARLLLPEVHRWADVSFEVSQYNGIEQIVEIVETFSGLHLPRLRRLSCRHCNEYGIDVTGAEGFQFLSSWTSPNMTLLDVAGFLPLLPTWDSVQTCSINLGSDYNSLELRSLPNFLVALPQLETLTLRLQRVDAVLAQLDRVKLYLRTLHLHIVNTRAHVLNEVLDALQMPKISEMSAYLQFETTEAYHCLEEILFDARTRFYARSASRRTISGC